MTGLLILSVLINATAIFLALSSPNLDRERVASEVEQLLPIGASIGGDWAPIFALGTELKALYMNEVFNPPGRVKFVRPDYLLLSDTFGMRNYRDELESDATISVGPSIYESEYKDQQISVHRLTYGVQPERAP